jgi:hypothetical protein
MTRWSVVGLAACTASAIVVAAVAAASGSIKATLSSKVPLGAPVGSRFAVTWTLKRQDGTPYNAKGVFVRVVCPEGDVTTTAPAREEGGSQGTYRAVATVPAGGIGKISIGSGNPPRYFAVTNPVRR